MRWHVGTSGWGYDAWRGTFYPGDIAATQRIVYYARHLSAVEINNSFYHQPTHEQFLRWQEAVPEHFTFTVKASRYVTHQKKLKDAEQTLSGVLEPLKRLPKFGPVIFQLPPHWHKDIERLKQFLALLPRSRRFAMEFRDPSWHEEDVYQLLHRHNVAFCLFEKGEMRSPRPVTADFIYVRLHGRKGGYKGNYSARALRSWHRWLSEQGRDIYIFFDNTDEKLYAVENALAFRELAGS